MKNTLMQVKITDINPDGNGVGRIASGQVLFVPGTAPGDEVIAKIIKENKGFLVGRTQEILTPSADRISPDCPHFPQCGGCSFRHITYEKELEIKQKLVEKAFRGFDTEIEVILSAGESRYRNKVQYPVGVKDREAVFGYYARRSHRIVPHSDCALQDAIFTEIAERTLDYLLESGLKAYDETNNSGTIKHLLMRKNERSEISLCVVLRRKADLSVASKKIAAEFPQIVSVFQNINSSAGNTIMGTETIHVFGTETLVMQLCGREFEVSPESFFQINTRAAELLLSRAREYCKGEENPSILDLYCGVGSVGQCVADIGSRLCGTEIVAKAASLAASNAVRNGCKEGDAFYFAGDTEKTIAACIESFGTPDIVITDPPRKGMSPSVIESISKINPKKILYISCNPATAARDAALLSGHAYYPKKITPVDLFPRTGHVETVCLMSKVEG